MRADSSHRTSPGPASPPESLANHLRLVPQPATASGLRPATRSFFRLPPFLKSGLFLAFAASCLVTIAVVGGLGGWRYYWTPLDVRAYTDLHPLLRPSGAVGRWLGIVGLALMLVMHVYSLRKRARWLGWMGPVTFWLEFHIFCGLFGPVLITLHTSFKFNGLISVAYWSMVIVVCSGFVGRYLYVRIPRSLRGQELNRQETSQRANLLKEELAASGMDRETLAAIEDFERAHLPHSEDDTTWLGLIFGELGFRLRLRKLSRRLRREGLAPELARHSLRLFGDHALLLRRIFYLKKTKRLFDLWRVYHKPLAVLMAVIVTLHVAVVWYFGYAFGKG